MKTYTFSVNAKYGGNPLEECLRTKIETEAKTEEEARESALAYARELWETDNCKVSLVDNFILLHYEKGDK